MVTLCCTTGLSIKPCWRRTPILTSPSAENDISLIMRGWDVARDGIEPPTLGFSVLQLVRDYVTPLVAM
jgi:hypothetical protein